MSHDGLVRRVAVVLVRLLLVLHFIAVDVELLMKEVSITYVYPTFIYNIVL